VIALRPSARSPYNTSAACSDKHQASLPPWTPFSPRNEDGGDDSRRPLTFIAADPLWRAGAGEPHKKTAARVVQKEQGIERGRERQREAPTLSFLIVGRARKGEGKEGRGRKVNRAPALRERFPLSLSGRLRFVLPLDSRAGFIPLAANEAGEVFVIAFPAVNLSSHPLPFPKQSGKLRGQLPPPSSPSSPPPPGMNIQFGSICASAARAHT